MKIRNLLILLFAICGSLGSLMAQTTYTVTSNVFSVDTRDRYTVTFDLGDYGTRSGGGALVQTILHAQPATAPTLTVTDGWVFDSWSEDFSAVISDLTVDAVITPNTTDADEDGLSYYDEVIVHGSDPNNPDSSGDGYGDGVIVGLGLDPVDDFSGFAQLVREETQDLRIGAEIATVTDAAATLQIVLEESDDLSSWSHRETVDLVVPLQAGESMKFFRYAMKGSGESEFPVPGDADNFALIPAGSFTMGDSLDGLSNAPMHEVQVSGFYMGKHEVSWSLWQEVRSWAAGNGYDIGSVGSGKDASHPVHSVNWYDVVKWCNAASERAGLDPVYYLSGAVYRSGESTSVTIDYSKQGYRLPTEAEWEKAARGGASSQRFPWGNTIDHTHANYNANGDAYSYDVSLFNSYTYHPEYDEGGTPYTSPVNSFTANGYGLYNMSGNVWEWCNDWYGSSYYSSLPGTDPQGPSTGSYRVQRGGSWNINALHCRIANRYYNDPGLRNNYGFRLALSE